MAISNSTYQEYNNYLRGKEKQHLKAQTIKMRDLIDYQLRQIDSMKGVEEKRDQRVVSELVEQRKTPLNIKEHTSIGNMSATIGQSLQHLQKGLYTNPRVLAGPKYSQSLVPTAPLNNADCE